MEYNLGYQIEKYHTSNKFKAANLDQLDYTSDNDSKSIIDFDDEYSEVSTLYPKQIRQKDEKKIKKKSEENINEEYEEDDENNDYENTETNIQNNTMEKKIINQNLKLLMEIDTNDKQAVIDILMQDNLIQKKPIETNDIIREKNKNKFYYVESKSKKEFTNNKKNSYGRKGYLIEAQEGDPEFVKDINVAGLLLKDQIQETNENVAKLLFDEFSPNPSTKRIITRKEIGDKVKIALDKKRKNLEKIEAEMYEEQKAEETFSPMINHRKKDGKRRNLDNFLRDQNNYQKKVEQKRHNILLKSESEKQLMYIGHPNINKVSEEIAKKINNDENVYIRLYKAKSKSKNKEKELEKKIKEENERKIINKRIKKNPYSHIKSKLNIFNKSPDQTSNIKSKSKNNITEPNERNVNYLKKRTKSAVFTGINKRLFDIKEIPTNKMLWNKFNKNFENSIKKLNLDPLNLNEEIDENQYNQLLFNLGMVSYELEKNIDNKDKKKVNEENKHENNNNNNNNKNEINKIEEENPELLLENSLKIEENKVIKNSFNILKIEPDKDKIKLNDIKNFLIYVLNIQNYDLYQQFKSKHTPEELKTMFPPEKFKKEDIPEFMLKKQNEELMTSIDKNNKKNNKYFSISKDNTIIFTLDKFSLIKKDFNLFSLNYRNQKKKSKDDEKVLNYLKSQFPFKPKINEYSEKIYQKNRDKLYMITNDTYTTNSQGKKSNMEYIERILLLDKKRIAENQKKKEELDKNKIKECTFKPKLYSKYPFIKKQKKKKDEKNDKNDKNKKKNLKRFEELYQKGKEKQKSKRDRPKEEIEIEEQGNECTFQPDIYSLSKQKIPETKFTNDIYNEKEYKYLYERLKHGRLERMVKDSNNERFGLNNELKQFVKDNKEYNFLQNQAYFDPNDPYYSNFINNNQIIEEQNNFENNMNIQNNNINNINENGKDGMNNNNNNNENINNNNYNIDEEENNRKDNSEGDPEKKDEIPLLIIDVNIRQGIKKKIYVYEGDTPEALAEKFAKEHNLEPETKNKLQSLIHSHMVKLLTRIEEENQSVSEKSQNVNNNSNNNNNNNNINKLNE